MTIYVHSNGKAFEFEKLTTEQIHERLGLKGQFVLIRPEPRHGPVESTHTVHIDTNARGPAEVIALLTMAMTEGLLTLKKDEARAVALKTAQLFELYAEEL